MASHISTNPFLGAADGIARPTNGSKQIHFLGAGDDMARPYKWFHAKKIITFLI